MGELTKTHPGYLSGWKSNYRPLHGRREVSVSGVGVATFFHTPNFGGTADYPRGVWETTFKNELGNRITIRVRPEKESTHISIEGHSSISNNHLTTREARMLARVLAAAFGGNAAGRAALAPPSTKGGE